MCGATAPKTAPTVTPTVMGANEWTNTRSLMKSASKAISATTHIAVASTAAASVNRPAVVVDTVVTRLAFAIINAHVLKVFVVTGE